MTTFSRRRTGEPLVLVAAIWLATGIAAFARGKAPVPDPDAQAQVVRLIQELYERDLKRAKLPAEQTALAENMLQQATKAKAGTPEHYVLLKVAKETAVRAGDVQTALEAVEQIARTYDVDGAEIELETLVQTGDNARLPKQRTAVLERSMPLIIAAAAEDDYATATRLLEMALPVARDTREAEPIKQVIALDKRVEAAKDAYARAQQALKTLEGNPTDPEANVTVGWYYCLHKGDWDQGVPMLALSSDEKLKELARQELKGPSSPDATVALGDAWWDLAQSMQGDEKTALLFSAGYWYRHAQAKAASPLIQMRAQRRLDQIAELKLAKPWLPARELARAVAPFDEKRAKGYQEARARYLGIPVVLTNSIGMKLVLIPPGEFDMGAAQEEIDLLLKEAEAEDRPNWYTAHIPAQGPRRRVKITQPFYLGIHEVTQAEYQSVMGTNPSMYSASGRRKEAVAGQDTSRFPVEMVSWEDASQFCRKLSALPKEKAAGRTYRLPTEAEWEYACRAGTTTRYYFGNDEPRLGAYAWFHENSQGRTHPVGQKKPNAWGLCDMHGNAEEWCSDWYSRDYYESAPSEDPPGPSSAWGRVTRGASFAAAWSETFRSPSRGGLAPTIERCWLGFRVAVTVAP